MDTLEFLKWLNGNQQNQPWANLNPNGAPASPGAQATSAPANNAQQPQQNAPAIMGGASQQMNPGMMNSLDASLAQNQQQPIMQQPQMQSPQMPVAPLMPAPQVDLGGGGGSGQNIFSKMNSAVSDGGKFLKMLGL